MTLTEYISTINQRYKLGNATEHTYRGDLATLLQSLAAEIIATNEPKGEKWGRVDYAISKKNIMEISALGSMAAINVFLKRREIQF